MATGVQVYGTDWCGVTLRVRKYLMNARIPYEYHNIEQDQSADDFVLTMNDGRRRFPLVVIEERILISPTLSELQQALAQHRVRPSTTRRAAGM